jgi:hypothetical protein
VTQSLFRQRRVFGVALAPLEQGLENGTELLAFSVRRYSARGGCCS